MEVGVRFQAWDMIFSSPKLPASCPTVRGIHIFFRIYITCVIDSG